MLRDPTERFSDRVETYVRSRPSYPVGLYELLERECHLRSHWVIADIGSGTGLSTSLFLERGHRVLAVEPNREMRQAGERLLARFDRLVSVAGRAEATTLSSASVDLILAAQAFHWFDLERARREFIRILKPDGWVVLVWNERRKESSPFLRAYEELLQIHAVDYRQVDHTRIGDAELAGFFGEARHRSARFDHFQSLNFQSLRDRLLSSSYAPGESHPQFGAMMRSLRGIFELHQVGGRVQIEYDTRVHFGRLTR